MTDKYILDDDGNPIPCEDLYVWGYWMELKGVRRVGLNEFEINGEKISVSTVFLGINHAFGGGEPILWETMIFGGKEDQYQERYSSKEEAIAGHLFAIKLAKGEVIVKEGN